MFFSRVVPANGGRFFTGQLRGSSFSGNERLLLLLLLRHILTQPLRTTPSGLLLQGVAEHFPVLARREIA